MGEFFLPGALVDTVPVLSWDRSASRNSLYLAYTTRAVGAADSDTDAIIRTYNWSSQQWRPEIKLHGNSSRSQMQPWVSVDQSNGYAAVIWYDRDPALGPNKFHLYATFSTDAFSSGTSKGWFRLTGSPADTASAQTDLFEYIGMTAFQGAFYPAFLNNGTGSNVAWDIFCGRVPF
ncbi:MAG: hypothetical protein L6Q38_11550 [Nitrospira sp.]|nr:hypothetical protein [Nitrospira sp.]